MKSITSRFSRKPFISRQPPFFALALLAMCCWLAAVKSAVAQDQSKPVAGMISSGANAVSFAPTKYGNVKTRHVPASEAPRELFEKAMAGQPNPGIELKGESPKGGVLIRVDESYQIPEYAPPRKHNTATAATNSPAANLTTEKSTTNN